MKLIEAWKENAIAARKCGFNDVEVCQRARCNLEQLKQALAHDASFKERYEAAAANTTPLRW